ncbi:unnamed protein product [Acanthoscelides obtectus]|uniref:Uncharacterized protein n=1 Tax=Acanthoscelides obtectus TaxID=200917 RepID=A0A9P0L6N5_ACAOB|nr:unnamed protein product [Acanthoscelides obtectus]CAK1630906.1 hypothetical protein AOBTE_LOCUS6630 [Acanthoscelides obtectus]
MYKEYQIGREKSTPTDRAPRFPGGGKAAAFCIPQVMAYVRSRVYRLQIVEIRFAMRLFSSYVQSPAHQATIESVRNSPTKWISGSEVQALATKSGSNIIKKLFKLGYATLPHGSEKHVTPEDKPRCLRSV